MIKPNPLLDLLPSFRLPALNEASNDTADHEALVGVAQLVQLLLKAEFHEEALTTAATSIPHGLGRKPTMLIWTGPPTEPRVAYVPSPGIAGLWNDHFIVLQASAGTPTVYFALL